MLLEFTAFAFLTDHDVRLTHIVPMPLNSQPTGSEQMRESDRSLHRQLSPPPFRRLRGYAYDPSLSLRLETALINSTIFYLPWESDLQPGPVGEYIEVVDYDPASRRWYEPIDLNAAELLAQDGLPPAEGNPQFHQQMVYAVAMNTIRNFEKALGRPIFWSTRYNEHALSGHRDEFIQRLRIYPHALRAANAYYSPEKRALLFGYFPGAVGTVFTCLSHDIIAHETTHALLDGMHRRYVEHNHKDTLAFHEAFADLVALFQHFTFAEVLRHQISRTRGDLTSQSLLGELAQQFGEATGRYGSLRDAIGQRNPATGAWTPIQPDPTLVTQNLEPHTRGSLLVAAIFRAYLSIYKSRAADLLRIATSGSGILQPGAIHPDLVERLAAEAAKIAGHFLSICIRALDYCPPVDVTFGDYLRALVTADFDMVPDDRYGYRVSMIESFRQWGIVPEGVRAFSEEHLRLPFIKLTDRAGWNAFSDAAERLRPVVSQSLYFNSRKEAFDAYRQAQLSLHDYLQSAFSEDADSSVRAEFEKITGLVLRADSGVTGFRNDKCNRPHFEVHAIRPALRVSPDGDIRKQVIITITQCRYVPLDAEDPQSEILHFRGGSTLILDLDTLKIRYAVTRPIDDPARLERIRQYRRELSENDSSLRSTYFGVMPEDAGLEPFCLLHASD